MSFSRRRGRPRKIKTEGKDKGTTQLQRKRELGITSEPLDLCLTKGLITQEQHNAGIRLRWLYTLKLGSPTVSAYVPGELGGRVCRYEDSSWLAKRQQEYTLILNELIKNNSRKIVMDTCVFGRMPRFIYDQPTSISTSGLHNHKELNLLINGLESITSLTTRKKRTG